MVNKLLNVTKGSLQILSDIFQKVLILVLAVGPNWILQNRSKFVSEFNIETDIAFNIWSYMTNFSWP